MANPDTSPIGLEQALADTDVVPLPSTDQVPDPSSPHRPPRPGRWWRRLALALAASAGIAAWWAMRSPVEWLGPLPGGVATARAGSGWATAPDGAMESVLVRRLGAGPWRRVLGPLAGAQLLLRGQTRDALFIVVRDVRMHVAHDALRVVPLPAGSLIRPSALRATEHPLGLHASVSWVDQQSMPRSTQIAQALWAAGDGDPAPRRVAQGVFPKDGWWGDPVAVGDVVYWLATWGVGGSRRSELWSVPATGGTRRRLASGPGTWLILRACDDGLTWAEMNDRRIWLLWHRRTADGVLSAFGRSEDPGWIEPRAWHGRWYWGEAPETAPHGAPADLWCARLDGSDRRPVALGDHGRQARLASWCDASDGRQVVMLAAGDGPGSRVVCRVVTTGGQGRLQPLCSLPGGWDWRPAGLDGGYCYLTAVPRSPSGFAAWLDRVLRRKPAPMFCRVRVG